MIVSTGKSQGGRAVPIQWVQDSLGILIKDGHVEVSVEGLGLRGAFIGALIATLPDAVVEPTTPRRVTLR